MAARAGTTQRGPDAVAAALILAASLALFAPALFGPRAILIGDSLFHGIPMLHYLREVLYGDYSLLWTDLVYVGHPVFAESQGGFLNPLNLLVAALFEPLTGVDVYHFLCAIHTRRRKVHQSGRPRTQCFQQDRGGVEETSLRFRQRDRM